MTLPHPRGWRHSSQFSCTKILSFQPALPAKSASRSSNSVSYVTLTNKPRGKSSQPFLYHLDKKKAPLGQSNPSPSCADDGEHRLSPTAFKHPEEHRKENHAEIPAFSPWNFAKFPLFLVYLPLVCPPCLQRDAAVSLTPVCSHIPWLGVCIENPNSCEGMAKVSPRIARVGLLCAGSLLKMNSDFRTGPDKNYSTSTVHKILVCTTDREEQGPSSPGTKPNIHLQPHSGTWVSCLNNCSSREK